MAGTLGSDAGLLGQQGKFASAAETDAQLESHAYVVIERHMVAMRDGCRLATDIYRPAHTSDAPDEEAGARPVLLHRTPYNKAKAPRTECCLLPTGALSEPFTNTATAERFARRGYIVVMQDCRGRYMSEGRFSKYVNEGNDGVDTLEWICAQPWCNGKVGCFGLSYCAHVQVSLACQNPPGLSCLFLESGGFWDAFHDGVRHGGAFTMKQVTWAFRNAKVSPEITSNLELKQAMEAIDLKEWFGHTNTWREGRSPLSLAPDYERYIFEDWRNDTFNDSWKQCGLYAKGFLPNFADVPVMLICSWYDPYIGAMTDMFSSLSAAKDSPMSMILGPWTHGDHGLTYAGDVDFGPQSTFDRNVAPTFHAARLQWFEQHLQGRLGGGSPMPGSSPLFGSSPVAGASPLNGFSPTNSLRSCSSVWEDQLAEALRVKRGSAGLAQAKAGASMNGSLVRNSVAKVVGMVEQSNGGSRGASYPAAALMRPSAQVLSAGESGTKGWPAGGSPKSITSGFAAVKEGKDGEEDEQTESSGEGASVRSSADDESLRLVNVHGTHTLHGSAKPSSSAPGALSLALGFESSCSCSSHCSRKAAGAAATATPSSPQQRQQQDHQLAALPSALRPATRSALGLAGLGVTCVSCPVLASTDAASRLCSETDAETECETEACGYVTDGGCSSHGGLQGLVDPDSRVYRDSSNIPGGLYKTSCISCGSMAPLGGLGSENRSEQAKPGAGQGLESEGEALGGVGCQQDGAAQANAQREQSSGEDVQHAESIGAGGEASPAGTKLIAGAAAAAGVPAAALAVAKAAVSATEPVPLAPSESFLTAPSISGASFSAPSDIATGYRTQNLYPYQRSPVIYFRMGGGSGTRNPAGRLDHGGCWINAPTWPLPAQSDPEILYLTKDRRLVREAAKPCTTRSLPAQAAASVAGGAGAPQPAADPRANLKCPSMGLKGPAAALLSADARLFERRASDSSIATSYAEAKRCCCSYNADDVTAGGAKAAMHRASASTGNVECMSAACASELGGLSFVHDPWHPVPTLGGNVTSGEPVMVGGAFDQVERADFFGCSCPGRRLSTRPDVLSFSTPSLQADAEVTGSCELVLYFTSTAPDTDFCATLVDVYPPSEDYPRGFAMNVANGIQRARFAATCIDGDTHGNGGTAAVSTSSEAVTADGGGGGRGDGNDAVGAAVAGQYLTPGRQYRLTVKLNVASNLFKKGHRIRVDVASSNFPRYDLNWGLGPGETHDSFSTGGELQRRTVTNTVFVDASRPSQLLLPLRWLSDDGADLMAATRPLIPFSSRWRQRRPTWSR